MWIVERSQWLLPDSVFQNSVKSNEETYTLYWLTSKTLLYILEEMYVRNIIILFVSYTGNIY